MTERTTLYLDNDIQDWISKKRREDKTFSLTRLVNMILREHMGETSPELRKKRLELEMKRSEVDALAAAERARMLKQSIVRTDVEQIEFERKKQEEMEVNQVMEQVCRKAQELDGAGDISGMIDYFEKMMLEYPKYAREIGAVYDMKSWRKTAGYVEK